MKQKKLNKKLSLNKKTVADLNNGEMNRLKGGEPYTDDDVTCLNTCHTGCGQYTCGPQTCATCLTACGSLPACPCPVPLTE